MRSEKIKTVAPDRALRTREFCTMLGVSRATIWRRASDDPEFPKPFRLGVSVTAWSENEAWAYLAKMKSRRASAA